MLDKSILQCMTVWFFVLTSAGMSVAGPSLKPHAPLSISIALVQAGVASADIKRGETLEFAITAVSFMDAQDAKIQVDLADGAELISGETTWSGSLKKNEKRTITITVRSPVQGNGRIKARILVSEPQRASFSAEAVYVLDTQPKAKPQHEHRIIKDSKGRDVIEYR